MLWTDNELNRQEKVQEQDYGYNSYIPNFKTITSIIKQGKARIAADYLRLGLLYKYGGVYTDIDAYCIKPFTAIVNYANMNRLDMIAAYESDRHNGDMIVANGVMVATPQSLTLHALMMVQLGSTIKRW